MLSGILAAPGAVVGKALVYRQEVPVIENTRISATAIETEVQQFYAARAVTVGQLNEVKDRTVARFDADAGSIFSGHLMLIEDETLEATVLNLIRQEQLSATAAVQQAFDENIAELAALEDPYLRARAADLADLKKRFLNNLLGCPVVQLEHIAEPSILVAKDLAPSEMVQLDVEKVLGLITEVGSETAHMAIMARSIGLPTIVGVKEALSVIKNGDEIALDAVNNRIFVQPSETVREEIEQLANTHRIQQEELKQLKTVPAETLDGAEIELSANIGSSVELPHLAQTGVRTIGLYRTEFLFIDREQLPDEEEQYQAYKQLAASDLVDRVVIRTLDIGGDKDIPYLDLPEEMNPFLGWRAIRIGLDRKPLLRAQLRAILRASAHGVVSIMLPMLSTIAELMVVQEELEAIKKELDRKKLAYDSAIPLGVMIETPAAALMSEEFAQEVDFFSIGTNDLTQYTLAVDRGNERVASLYSSYDPAVLRLIHMVVQAGHRHQIPVCMCGEFAGEHEATPLLLGLGLDQLSMNASSILRVKSQVRSISLKAAQSLAREALTLKTAQAVRELIADFHERKDHHSK